MKLTIVGCGDAFGSGGRSNTCFRLDVEGRTLVVDFGASAMVAWARLGFDARDIDAIVLSHLHGDHFGGLPFVLLQANFVAGRSKPLEIVGPPGLKTRLDALCEAMFPGMTRNQWRFPLDVREVAPGTDATVAGCAFRSIEVKHQAGAPATGVRIRGGQKVFAYSGDTAWTDSLLEIADSADLMIVECYAGGLSVPNHLDWPTLRENLPRLRARRIMATHLGVSALPLIPEMEAAGVSVAQDGLSIEI